MDKKKMRRHRGCTWHHESLLRDVHSHICVAHIASRRTRYARLLSDISHTSLSRHVYFMCLDVGGFILDMNYYMHKTFSAPMKPHEIS